MLDEPAAHRRRTRRFPRAQSILGLVLFAPVLAAGIAPGLIAPVDPWASIAPPLLAPSGEHPFGTDDLGRDVFSAVVAGARLSLLVGAAVAALALVIGAAVGVVSGFLGGWWDDGLMRVTETVQVVPRFFVAILIAGLFGASLEILVLVLGLTSWPGFARMVRSETLSLRRREFVMAAMALGAGPAWIITRHVLPNLAAPLLAALPIVAGGAILTEAGLSYLGLSDPNAISWGRLIAEAQPFLYRAWWMSVFPGSAVVATVVGIALLTTGRKGVPGSRARRS